MDKLNNIFAKIAVQTAIVMGNPITFMLCCLVVLVWALSGPFCHWDNAWQLVINTGTTILTFLLVVLNANTQNRDMLTIHLKLDGLIVANEQASNRLLKLETKTDTEIKTIRQENHS